MKFHIWCRVARSPTTHHRFSILLRVFSTSRLCAHHASAPFLPQATQTRRTPPHSVFDFPACACFPHSHFTFCCGLFRDNQVSPLAHLFFVLHRLISEERIKGFMTGVLRSWGRATKWGLRWCWHSADQTASLILGATRTMGDANNKKIKKRKWQCGSAPVRLRPHEQYCQKSWGRRQEHVFFIIITFNTLMSLTPIFSTTQTRSHYPRLDRSLSSHQDTNQDFPAAGPGSLGEEARGGGERCPIIDNKRGI